MILGLGRSPGEGNGYPLRYSCLGNSMDRGAWWATVHRVTKSQTHTGITQYVTFSDWLTLLIIRFLKFIYVVAYILVV